MSVDKNSVCPKAGWEETLRDLHKEWKQGESSMLPVMDWMVWAVLQSERSEVKNIKVDHIIKIAVEEISCIYISYMYKIFHVKFILWYIIYSNYKVYLKCTF